MAYHNGEEYIDGFEVPVHKSLTTVMLLSGVPRDVCILNGAAAMMFIMIMHNFWVLPLNIIIHLVAVWVTKKDPQFFDCLRRYIHRKKFYSV